MHEQNGVMQTPMGAVGVTWADEVLLGVDLEPARFP